MTDDVVSEVTPLAALLERDRKWVEGLLARKELDREDGALLLNLLEAERAAATGDNELQCARRALGALLVNLDKRHPAFRGLGNLGLDPLGLLKRLHAVVQDYGAGAIASLNVMRGEMPDGRTNAAAPSEAMERARIAWCVHRLAVGGTNNGAFAVRQAARQVSKHLKAVGLPRTFLTVLGIYYAIRRGEDAEAASWFKAIEAEPTANQLEMAQLSKAERLAWLNGVTFSSR
jgi:hypothetical protein